MSIIVTKGTKATCHVTQFSEENAPYECHVRITDEESGGFSIECLSLPGVASQGESFDEAVENFREAFLGAIETYRELDQAIPWRETHVGQSEANTKEKWLLIHGS